jgi:hypothetical protein
MIDLPYVLQAAFETNSCAGRDLNTSSFLRWAQLDSNWAPSIGNFSLIL